MLTEEQIDKNWDTLLNTVIAVRLPRGVVEMLEDYKEDRLGITDCTSSKQIMYCGFKNAPAAKGNHHAYKGGLVKHYLEMWKFWLTLRDDLIRESDVTLMTDSNVLLGILLHDLHKTWMHFTADEKDPSKFVYGSHPTSLLMTADQKTIYLIQPYMSLNAYQMNMVFSSEGGYAKDAPMTQTILAKLVYILDELSSNVQARMEQGNAVDNITIGIPKPVNELQATFVHTP